MSKISTYEDAPLPKLSDKLIGTSVGGEIEDMTYNFTLQELLNVFLPVIPANNLQGILDYGNTATQDINLFGTINTTYINVTDTATILNSNLTGETRILGGLIDSTYSIGEAGQVLSSTGEFVEWVTLPPIFTPSLQQVLEVGNGSDINIILDATLQAFNVDSNTAIINDDLTISGTLTDSDSLVGTANQVLSSTVTGVKWIGLPIYSATSPLLFNPATGVFSIQEAASYQSGYLSSTDWINFDGKQPAGNYITTLIGEASASGPGAASVILNNASVLGKVLTGFNPTSGTINASDTILTAFEKTQSQINALVGGVIYRGTWNASANVPTLTSSVGVQGDYYVVNVAGNTNLNGITDWKVGDWAIFSESVWQKVDNTDSVSSVNGYTGAVNLTTDDIPEGLTNLYYLNSRARAALSATSPLLYDNSTGISSIQQSNNIQDGYLSSTDWVTFNNKQGAITLTTVGSSGPSTLISNTLNIPNYGGALTGYVPYTGATTNVNLGEYGISAGYFQADLTPTGTLQVGRMQWNAIDGTMDLRMMGNNVTLQIGEENVTRVVNKSGINLLESNYQVVRARKVAEGGAQGQRIAVVLAQGNSENNSTEVLGLVTETINTNQEGFITCFGEVKEIDTTGSLQGETWVDGDILYLSSTVAGALTNVRPIAPNHSVIVGYVTYAHAVHGKIYMAIDTGYELGELHNVYAPSPTANQSIYWNATNSRYQLNTIAGILGYTPADAATYVPYTGATTDVNLGGYSLLSASTSSNVFYANGSGLTPGTIYLKKGTVPVNFSGSNGIYANSTSYGFIADTGTSYKLGIFSLASLTDATARTYTLPNASGTLALTSDLSGYVPYNGATGAVNLGAFDLTVNGITIGRGASSIASNTAIGVSSLQLNSTGSYNTGFGLNSLNKNTIGSNNTSIGADSLSNLTTGNNNTVIGYTSGTSITTGSNNTIIGNYDGTAAMNNNIILADGNGNIKYQWDGTNNNLYGKVNFSSTIGNGTYTYTLPNASGTLALTSDLGGYVPYSGATGAVNLGVNSLRASYLYLNGATTPMSGQLNMKIGTSSPGNQGGYYNILPYSDGKLYFTSYLSSLSNTRIFILDSAGITANTPRIFTFPDASGTLALTSDLGGYVPYTGATTNLNLGAYALIVSGINNASGMSMSHSSAVSPGAGSTAINGTPNGLEVRVGASYVYSLIFPTANYNYTFPSATGTLALTSDLSGYVTLGTAQTITSIKTFNARTDFNVGISLLSNSAINLYNTGNTFSTSLQTNPSTTSFRVIYLPNANGTVALTSDLSAYLPLTGGTLTGALSGTSATFSGVLSAKSATITETTANTYGSISVVGNSRGGSVDFYANATSVGGIYADASANLYLYSGNSFANRLTIASTGAATFSSTATIKGVVVVGASGGYTTGDNNYINLGGAATPDTFGAINMPFGDKMRFNAYHGFQWYTSNAGGSGTPVSKMILTSDGNVGIGAINPTVALYIGDGTSAKQIVINGSASGTTGGASVGVQYNGVTSIAIGNYSNLVGGAFSNLGSIYTAGDMLFLPAGVERMRIKLGGNVLIGLTTDSGDGLQVQKRIAANTGIVTYATTNTNYPLSATAQNGIYMGWGSSTTNFNGLSWQGRYSTDMYMGGAGNSGDDSVYIRNASLQNLFRFSPTGNFTVLSLAGAGSRTVTADANGLLSAASDSSLKQEDKEYNIAGLNEVLQLIPRAYKWLNDIENRGEDAATEIGFFANEVAPIIPSAAPKSNDGLFGFYDRAVIAALVKSVQQLNDKLIKNNIN